MKQPYALFSRRFRSLTFRITLVVWLGCIVYWLTRSSQRATIDSLDLVDDFSFKLILLNLYKRSPHLGDVDIAAQNYKKLEERVSLFDFLKDNDYQQRCDAYFDQLFRTSKKWWLDPGRQFNYNKNYFNDFEKYRVWKVGEMKKEIKKKEEERKKALAEAEAEAREIPEEEAKKEHKKETKEEAKEEAKGKEKQKREEKAKEVTEDVDEDEVDPDELPDKYFHDQLAGIMNMIRFEEQLLHDYFSHIRVFDRCYLSVQDQHYQQNTTKFIKDQHNVLRYLNYQGEEKEVEDKRVERPQCDVLESKLFPWVSRELPVYERYDGLVHTFPQFEPRSLFSGFFGGSKDGCFLSEYKSRLNGRGIVLTISDDHLDDATRLIRLLRSLKNQLPIQVVYHTKFSKDTKRQLILASRSPYGGLPKQDIWFVDVNRAINKSYLNKFHGFGNKISATLFNSFAEMILIDADTVMLKEPAFFFSLQKYVNTGTMFYKDRLTFEFRPKHDLIFFKKLLPSIMDSVVFNIPQITEYSLGNEFFQGLNHFMESGLVVINRRTHFSQPLVMSQLNFHYPVQARIYGDKELFWMALVISGDENYSFNAHFAASIGDLTPEAERVADVKKAQTFRSKEICSNHPGHINDADNHTLLWFNSGFYHCGQLDKVDFAEEFKRKKRYTRAKTFEEFKHIFESKLSIPNAIIPPFDMKEVYRYNNQNEPDRAWINIRDYCYGYTWCAYSSMGGLWKEDDGTVRDTTLDGILIEYSKEEQKTIAMLGNVWTSDYDYSVYVRDYKEGTGGDHHENSGGVRIN